MIKRPIKWINHYDTFINNECIDEGYNGAFITGDNAPLCDFGYDGIEGGDMISGTCPTNEEIKEIIECVNEYPKLKEKFERLKKLLIINGYTHLLDDTDENNDTDKVNIIEVPITEIIPNTVYEFNYANNTRTLNIPVSLNENIKVCVKHIFVDENKNVYLHIDKNNKTHIGITDEYMIPDRYNTYLACTDEFKSNNEILDSSFSFEPDSCKFIRIHNTIYIVFIMKCKDQINRDNHDTILFNNENISRCINSLFCRDDIITINILSCINPTVIK